MHLARRRPAWQAVNVSPRDERSRQSSASSIQQGPCLDRILWRQRLASVFFLGGHGKGPDAGVTSALPSIPSAEACSAIPCSHRQAAGNNGRGCGVRSCSNSEVKLTPARQAGYDATESDNGEIRRLQIKGRCVPEGSKPGQRMGSIDVEKEIDAVLLVLLDGNFEATAIYEAQREPVVRALTRPGSKARNDRGALGVSKFNSIGHLRWQRESVTQPGDQH